MVIWIIGLSASGKTRVGSLLAERLRERAAPVVFLDGDSLRAVWGDGLGHDIASRRVQAGRVSRLCKLLDHQGVHVVTAILSLFPEWRQWNRANLNHYFQVYLDVPFDELRRRDPNGIYAAAARGEMEDVVGIDIPWPVPDDSNVAFSGPAAMAPPDEIVGRIVEALDDHAPGWTG